MVFSLSCGLSLANLYYAQPLLHTIARALHCGSGTAGLAPETRSRVTSVYMVMYFAGGALGSAVGGALYDSQGWARICVLGAVIGAAALLVWGCDAMRPTSAEAAQVRRRAARSAKNHIPLGSSTAAS